MKRFCSLAAAGAVLFGSAGRIDVLFFWAHLGVMALAAGVGLCLLSPELLKERARPGPGGRDRRVQEIAGPFFFAHYVCAGLDVGRYHWSDSVPAVLQTAGLVCFAGSLAITLWAMRANIYFSPVVRVQTERSHRLVTDGPYRYVRHPGYLATLVWLPSSALTLGSWWSLAPLAVVFALLVRRVVIEDGFLHASLDGYSGYAARVRYRIIPCVW